MLFTAFCVSSLQGKTPDCYLVGRMVWEAEITCNWFRSIFLFNIIKMAASFLCFSQVNFSDTTCYTYSCSPLNNLCTCDSFGNRWSGSNQVDLPLFLVLQNFMSLRYDVSYFAPALDIYVTSFFFILILRRDATSFRVAVHPTTFSPSFSENNTVGHSHDA